MRVLHIGKFFPPYAGGIEQFLADLLPTLRDENITTAALVHGHGTHNGTREHHRGCPIYRAPSFGRLCYAPLSPTFPLWLQRAISDFQPQLLHLHMPNTSAFWALLSPAAKSIPWLIHWHADVVSNPLDRRLRTIYPLYRPFEQKLLAMSSSIVVTSSNYLDASDALVTWRQRCRVIPLGLDPQRLIKPTANDIRQAAALWPGSGCRVLAIGRLTYYKGFEVLLRALAERPELQLVIVGSGERHGRLKALISELGIQQRVRLAGYQTDGVRNALLAECDMFCLPSLERTEAFGVVLLEAMAYAKPIVASDIAGSGVGWVVRESGAGLLMPPADSDALGNALAALASDSARRAVLGTSGRQALQHRFAIGPVARQLAMLYRTLGGATRRPGKPPPVRDAEKAG